MHCLFIFLIKQMIKHTSTVEWSIAGNDYVITPGRNGPFVTSDKRLVSRNYDYKSIEIEPGDLGNDRRDFYQ